MSAHWWKSVCGKSHGEDVGNGGGTRAGRETLMQMLGERMWCHSEDDVNDDGWSVELLKSEENL